MTTDQDKCSLSSLLSMSCRGRAEAFARRLHSRLRSLGSQDGATDESSWLGTHEAPIAMAQPRHHSDSDHMFFDFDILHSPEAELEAPELEKLIDNNVPCQCPQQFQPLNGDNTFFDAEENTVEETSDNITIKPNLIDRTDHINGENSDEETVVEEKEVPNCSSSLSELSNLSLVDDLSSRTELLLESPNNIKVVLSTSQDSVTISKDDDEEEIEERVPRVRRCSSLKTGKTPPGTPGRKKIVRFADVLGLDLADVRTFLDEIPKIPISAYDDLTNVELSDSSVSVNPFKDVKIEKILVALFQQPGGQPSFLDRVRDKQVSLENAVVQDPVSLAIGGTVRVRNLDFHKSVHIRYSLDSWQTCSDLQATYLENSCDGFSDKFSFLLYAHSLTVGQRVEFAVRFQCKGCQYWDNNNGVNYCFQCLPATSNTPYVSSITSEDSYGASFYY